VLENFLTYCIKEKDSCVRQMTIDEGKDLLQLQTHTLRKSNQSTPKTNLNSKGKIQEFLNRSASATHSGNLLRKYSANKLSNSSFEKIKLKKIHFESQESRRFETITTETLRDSFAN